MQLAVSDFLEGLDSTDEIELTVTGRKSGRSSSRLVWFVHEEGKLYLLPVAGSVTSWYRNVVGSPSVRISAQGKSIAVKAISITEPGIVSEVVEKFRSKHGSAEIKRYYTGLDVAIEIPV